MEAKEIEKNILKEYINNNKDSNNDVGYIYRLYKNYALISKYINKYPTNAESDLQKLENDVYTINNKVLSEPDKLKIEFNRIFNNQEKLSIEDDQKLLELYDLYEKDSYLDNDLRLQYLKKQISILQAKLGLENNFFLATYIAFIELYNNIYISSVQEKRIDEASGRTK